MQHLTEIDLQLRAKDVFNNLFILNKEAKLGLRPVCPEAEGWMVRWTDILEEYVIRHGTFSARFMSDLVKDCRIPDPCGYLASRAANAIKTTFLPKGEYLFKYGKAKDLKEAIEDNILKISPATSYADSSLNPAIRDEELDISINPMPSKVKIGVYNSNTRTLNWSFGVKL